MVEQIPTRAAVRAPMALDDASLGAVALWTILRWERTFLLIGLEDLGIDVWRLTCEVDTLLNEYRAKATRSDGDNRERDAVPAVVEGLVNRLLDRAEREAQLMDHDYLGTEHLLLAILDDAEGPLASILSRYGVTSLRVKAKVEEMLENKVSSKVVVAEAVDARPKGPRYASWDTEAVGVPRRFGMSVMFLMMTMYAVLFAAMQALKFPPVVFSVIALMVTGVGFGQMVLFGGRYPRAASIWSGACLFPVVMNGALLWGGVFSGRSVFTSAALMVSATIPWVLVGAVFGYLAGGLTAGVFLLIEMYWARREAAGSQEEENKTQDEKPVAPTVDVSPDGE